jgi:hypothetical protein
LGAMADPICALTHKRVRGLRRNRS